MKNNILQPKEKSRVRGVFTIEARRVDTGELVERIVSPNLVMVGSYTGLDQFVRRLTGDTTYTGTINYIAIGTASTAVATTDTRLAGESTRAVISTAQDLTNNQARIKAFFPDAQLQNGTYREIGAFIDGTATRDSGKIFNRALFSTSYAKVAGVDTTAQIDIFFT